MNINDERELVRLGKRGDKQALDELLRSYESKIKALAHKVCSGLPAEAEDVFQESFIQAFSKIKQYQGRSSFGNWLYTITANLCWRKHREKKRKREVSLPEVPLEDKGSPQPDRSSEQNELRRLLGKVLEELDEGQRRVLILSDLEGKTNPEIAKKLKLSLPAVKSRLLRAREYLRQGLQEYYNN